MKPGMRGHGAQKMAEIVPGVPSKGTKTCFFFTGSILTWRSGPGPLPHVKFHPYRCSDGVLDPKSENFTNFFKTKFRYKKPQRSARTVTSLRRRLTRFASLTFDSPALVFPSQNCAVFHTCHENG